MTGVVGALALLLIAPLAVGASASSDPQDNGIFDSGTAATAEATVLPNFQESVVFSGLTNPTAIRFAPAPDTRIFVAEKSGLIKVFDSLTDTTPTLFTDLSTTDGTPDNVLVTNVHNFWDRGLLGMALPPNFPANPYVYVLYTYDHALGSTSQPPRWGTAGAVGDGCPTPPGATGDGCVVSARLSRLQVGSNNVMTGTEQVLVEDWCQQFPSHSIGSLNFGQDGQLYVSGGDGASFNYADYGQTGNPCGDPPSPAGTSLTSPSGEGGALRSQDLRTSADPTTLDGAILRLDPTTGAASAGNPLGGSADTNARRIVAEGLRNPFRFTIRPGTNEVWIGDVGWNTWEEINRIANPTAGLTNFGWPCYEGTPAQSGYSGLTLCANLPAGAVTAPYYAYTHSQKVVPNETCPPNPDGSGASSSISGMAFYQSGSYPSSYNGALFFADHSRNCIWVMFPGGNGLPDPTNRATFVAAAAGPVDLQIGPGGDLFYVDYDAGTIRRISYTAPPPPPGDLVAAYSFDENGGTSVADASGNGNGGSIGTATWTSGKFGNALSFNGSSAKVTIADAASLHLTNGMTLEAWVSPSVVNAGWRDVIYKGNDNYYLSGTTPSGGGVPAIGAIFNGSYGEAFGTTTLPLNTWSHMAATYDGTALRLFVNGTQVSSTSQLGAIATSTNPLQIGGDAIYGQYFSGKIDEVRVFSSARTAAQVASDMNTAIGSPPGDTGPPTAPSNLTATAVSQTQINLSWAASQDDVGVTLYHIERCQGAGCTTFVEIGTTTHPVTTFSNTGLAAGTTYRYQVRAQDAVPNFSTYSNIATASTLPPNASPTATISAPSSTTTWKVGDVIDFSGSATDSEDGNLPASGLTWTLLQEHCPSNCHEHIVQTFAGVASGQFTAPDHEYPSFLRLRLTATDSQGASSSTSVDLQPITVDLTFNSSPSGVGLQLTLNGTTNATPFTKTVIQGSNNSLTAPSPQTPPNGTTYAFSSWSDGGLQTHNVTANAGATYTATYQAVTSADLRITKTGSSSNGTATWTLAVANLGPNTAQNVVVTDVLPSRLTFVSASAGCTYASATRTVTCQLGTLANGANTPLTITTTITGNGGGWITNTAQVASSTSDPNSANNSSSDRVKR